MKFFKNRFVAILLCVLVVIGSTLLNTRIKLGGQCRDTARGLYADGGIAQQIPSPPSPNPRGWTPTLCAAPPGIFSPCWTGRAPTGGRSTLVMKRWSPS